MFWNIMAGSVMERHCPTFVICASHPLRRGARVTITLWDEVRYRDPSHFVTPGAFTSGWGVLVALPERVLAESNPLQSPAQSSKVLIVHVLA